jgi:hypothetical protein
MEDKFRAQGQELRQDLTNSHDPAAVQTPMLTEGNPVPCPSRVDPPPQLSVKELLKKRKGISTRSNLVMCPIASSPNPVSSPPSPTMTNLPNGEAKLKALIREVVQDMQPIQPMPGTGRRGGRKSHTTKLREGEKAQDESGERNRFLVSCIHHISR